MDTFFKGIITIVTVFISLSVAEQGIAERRSDVDSGDVSYMISVESDGSYTLKFPPGKESELADCLDWLIREKRLSQIEFADVTDPNKLLALEELMHDKNYTISSRHRATTDGTQLLAWMFHTTHNRVEVFIKEVSERQYRESDRRDKVVSVNATRLGKHIQSGELHELNPEICQLTLYFDDEGKTFLQKLVSQNRGQKLGLQAEGVTIGTGEVPVQGDTVSLTFTFSPDKFKRLEHAFEMSKLQLIRTKR